MLSLSPKNDLVFKALFGRHPNLLENALNGFLEHTGVTPISDILILNPEIRPADVHEKFIVLDIRAKDAHGRTFNVEMQVRQHLEYGKRTLYYWSKLYSSQLQRGEDYDQLRPTFGIHLLDFSPFADSTEPHYRFRLSDCRFPERRWCDDLEIHLLDLTQLQSRLPQLREEEWMYFLNRAMHEEESKMLEHIKNPAIHEAYAALKELSADAELRELALQRELQIHNEVTALKRAKEEGLAQGREEGIQKGREEGKQDGMRNMLTNLLERGRITQAEYDEELAKLPTDLQA